MSERRLRLLTVALALAGAAIASYLSYTRLVDTSIMCPTTGCATVQRSEYSELANIPVAYIGVAGYLAIAVAAVGGRRNAGGVLVAVAVAFATYLLVAQFAFIDAVCVWCLASDAVLGVLLAVTAFRFRRSR